MAPWTNTDFPPLTHPARSTRPITQSTRPMTQSTRPMTQLPTRPPVQPSHAPSILGNPPAHLGGGFRNGGGGGGGRRGGSRGRGGGGGGSHRGGSGWGQGRGRVYDHQSTNYGGGGVSEKYNVGEMCEKFDELEVLEESCELAAKINEDLNYIANDVDNDHKNVINSGVKVNNGNNNSCDDDFIVEIPVKASGVNVPKPVKNFGEIADLGMVLHENIKRCKYVKPTPIQCHAIPILMAGRDLMACAQTGSGKTAAFCFPIIARILKNGGDFQPVAPPRGGGGYCSRGREACPVALIMAPTRELSCQIHDEAKKFAYQTGVKVVVAYGGTPMSEQLHKLDKGVDILVATPGRLVDMIERGRVSLRMVKYFALDEADRMLDMGFEPQIRKIAEQLNMPSPGARQTMLFSATFPTEIQKLASDFLSNYIFLTVGKLGSSNDLIEQKVEFVNEIDKRKHLKDLLVSQNGTNGKQALTIVFVETKRAADELAHWLSRTGFPATAIHGDKVQLERERALRSFKTGATPIIVATDVAARGLDIPCVAHVVNFDLPRDIEHYVHRIGRTGRAGNSGLATAFFCDKDMPISKALADLMEEANQAVPSWLTEYANSSSSYGYGGGTGGGRRNRGGKFGGRDYRSFDHNAGGYTGYSDYAKSNSDYNSYTQDYSNNNSYQDYSSNYTADYSSSYTADYSSNYSTEAPIANSCATDASNLYSSTAYVPAPGCESVVATGWD